MGIDCHRLMFFTIDDFYSPNWDGRKDSVSHLVKCAKGLATANPETPSGSELKSPNLSGNLQSFADAPY